MQSGQFRAVILDMDGVLTQTAGLHARAWKRTFDAFLQSHGQQTGRAQEPFDIETDYPRYVDGKPRYDGVQSFLESRGIALPWGEETDPADRETVCGLGNRKNELFHELLRQEGVAVYDEAVSRVRQWRKAGIKTAVITSSRNGTRILESAGLLDLFDVKIDGNDAARLRLEGKPAPDVFLRAAEQLGVGPAESVVVEDAIAGVEAGRKGEFGLVVGVARRSDGRRLKEAGADLVVNDLRELNVDGDEVEPARAEPEPALDHVDAIGRRLKGGRLASFLDYDGTLTPIVARPEDAILSDGMRSLLDSLSRHCTLAIVSGRDRRDVEQLVGLKHLVYAGSHGFDIRGPGLKLQNEEAGRSLPDLDKAEQQLEDHTEDIPGARVERKRFAIAVHYRQTPDEFVQRVEQVVKRVAKDHARLRCKGGKKIFELQPDIKWDKGEAVLWLRQALGVDDPDVLTIYIGDDVTDEDAFRALAENDCGLGILVGEPASATQARYVLKDTGAVEQLLRRLLQLVG